MTLTPEQLDAIEARAVASDAGCPVCKSDVEIAGTTTRFFISMIRRDQVRALVTAIRERDAEIERIAKKSDTQHGLLCRVSQERNELRDQLRIAREALEDITHPNMDPRGPADGAIRIARAALAATEGK
jgi:pheromone shutdown protein TraB